jgi:hypothetical protein
MKLRSTAYSAVAAMFVFILSMGISAGAQDLQTGRAAAEPALNLSDAQVFKIQALLSAQTTGMQSLIANVHSARETLNTAVAAGDPVRTAMAVLSLDAAEKALKITQTRNQQNLLSLLNDSQKQTIAARPVHTSD